LFVFFQLGEFGEGRRSEVGDGWIVLGRRREERGRDDRMFELHSLLLIGEWGIWWWLEVSLQIEMLLPARKQLHTERSLRLSTVRIVVS
jgi:hypothetical protein